MKQFSSAHARWAGQFSFGNHQPFGWFPGGNGDHQRPEVAPNQEFAVTIQEIDNGIELGKIEATDDTGVASYRILSRNLDADRDGTPAFTVDEGGTLRVADLDDVSFGIDGKTTFAVAAVDEAGNQSAPQLVSVALTTGPLIPADTPFGYYIGINYESWDYGRVDRSIAADLEQVTQYFKLIRTYHDAAVGTPNPTSPIIDDSQAEVISYVVATNDVQLVMGTNNSALAQPPQLSGDPWLPGLMTDKAYTDAWVQMLIDAFGSVENVLDHLTAILLGNEVDANGPPPTDESFSNYITWIATSFDNLKASLNAAGLGSIPISTTIANYGSTNQVAVDITQYINDHWSADWNSGTPFVLFNQYTQEGMTSTDFTTVEKYFEWVQTQVPADLEVFIGETGYSTTSGTANPAQDQADVYQQIFNWLDGMDGQQGNGATMVPMFPFIAFDRPTATPGIEVGFGIFGWDKDTHQPTGLKPDLVGVVPEWTDDPINTQMLAGETLLGTTDNDVFDIAGGVGSIDGGDGTFDLLMLDGERDDFVFERDDSNFPRVDFDYYGLWAQPEALRIESKEGDATSIEIKNVEYILFNDQLVRVEDLLPSHHLPHHWSHFDLG